MMQLMREKIQGLIAGVIAFVIALTFALWGIQNYLHTNSGALVVAKVNGEKITVQQVNVAYERVKRQEMLQAGGDFSLDQKSQAQLKAEVLQQLINKQVITTALKNMGFGIGQKQLGAIVAGLPIFQVNGRFSAERFQQIIENLYFNERNFLTDLEQSLIQIQLEKGIIATSFVLNNEVSMAQKLSHQKRDFAYAIVAPSRFNSEVKITTADVKKYYQEHQAEFTTPERISIQYLQLSADSLQQTIVPTTAQLQEYFQSHSDSFTSPKRWQIIEVLEPLTITADKKAVNAAQAKLQDYFKQTKAGGDLTKIAGSLATTSWVLRNELAPEVAAQLEKLAVGQMSEPFRTREGLMLVKVLALQPGVAQTYAAVADKVKQAYIHQQLLQKFSEQNDKLTDLTYTNSDSLTQGAQALNLPIQVTGLFTKDGEKTGILANPKILKAAFSDAVLQQNYNSNPIEISSGNIIVLRIKDRVPEAIRTLAQVENIIQQKLQTQATQKLAQDFSQKVLAELQGGAVIAAVEKNYNLDFHTITGAERTSNLVVAKIVHAAFDLNKPQGAKPEVSMVELTDGYALVKLTGVINAVEQTASSQELANYGNELAQDCGQYEYALLTDGIIHKAKIKIMENMEKES